jgi:hypothetical protein
LRHQCQTVVSLRRRYSGITTSAAFLVDSPLVRRAER